MTSVHSINIGKMPICAFKEIVEMSDAAKLPTQRKLMAKDLVYALFYMNILRFLPILLNMMDQTLQVGGMLAYLGEYIPLAINFAICILLIVLHVKKKQAGLAPACLLWFVFCASNIAGKCIPDSQEQLSSAISIAELAIQLVFYILYCRAMGHLTPKNVTDVPYMWKVCMIIFIIVYVSSLGAVGLALVPSMEGIAGFSALVFLLSSFLGMVIHVYVLHLTARTLKD